MFVVELTYKVDLSRIDAHMAAHVRIDARIRTP